MPAKTLYFSMYWRVLLLCVTVLTSLSGTEADSPPVLAWLKTDWPAPPLALEAIEFIGQERGSSLFSYISHLASTNFFSQVATASEETTYREIITGLETNLGHSDQSDDGKPFLANNAFLSLLKLALSTRSNAPRVQAKYKLYSDIILPKVDSADKRFDANCEAWVDWYGTQACTKEHLETLIEQDIDSAKASNSFAPPIFSFDHVFPSGAEDRGVAILYADLQSTAFLPLHESLMDMARNLGIVYVLRYKPPSVMRQTLEVSGYGVELALKSTEYKAVDDRDTQKGDEASSTDSQAHNRMDKEDPLYETPPRIIPLNQNETKELGTQTAQFILKSINPLTALVDISQNFPKFAHLLKDVKVDEELASGFAYNRARVSGRRNGLWINGMELDAERIDVFTLQRTIRAEVNRVMSLMSLNLTSQQVIDLLTTPLGEKRKTDFEWGDAFDVRSDVVVWWNDLEKDSRYRNWPSGIQELLRPSYPGQLKYLRKNMMNVLFQLDLTNARHLQTLMQVFEFIERDVPIRFGFAPLVDDIDDQAPASLAAAAFYHLRETAKLKDAKSFIVELYQASGGDRVTAEGIEAAYATVTGKTLQKSLDTSGEMSKEVHNGLRSFALRTGSAGQEGAIFLNGKFLDLNDEWQQSMITTYFQMLEYLINNVYTGQIRDDTDIYKHFLTLPNVYPKRNNLIFGAAKLVNLLECEQCHFVDQLEWLSSDAAPSTVSIIVAADFSSEEGTRIASEALSYVSTADGVRISFLHSGKESVSAPLSSKHLVLQGDGNEEDFANFEQLETVLKAHEPLHRDVQRFLQTHGAQSGQTLVLINGRILGPVSPRIRFDAEDFALTAGLEYQQRIGRVAKKLAGFLGELANPEQSNIISAKLLKATSALAAIAEQNSGIVNVFTGSKARLPIDAFGRLNKKQSTITVGTESSSLLRFFAIIDPVSEPAQQLSALLRVLAKLDGTFVEILLNPDAQLGEHLPIKRFYRFVLTEEPQFDEATGALKRPAATFYELPVEPLYTLGMDVPNSWLVFPSRSVHDLDNIRLSSLKQGGSVEAEFLLENILVEGHAKDSRTNGPPRGLQFVLGTKPDPSLYDTITMANLGYLQLKANPGIWDLRLREGRSTSLYDIETVTDIRHQAIGLADGVAKILVDSFEGITVLPVVRKKKGMEKEDVLAPEGDKEQGGGIWNQLKNNWFGSKTAKANETINIFSVASGHLYERFLSIMILSVMKNTKSPVKFWFIRNFLSPSFKEFIPHLAEAYGFEYELVTYKWPHWLRQQTEKQRTIWGYKILFLDVLFPLSLDKVIFVDADQVVRTDLKELVEMDLHGAVYGYTPFCDDREEMEGFRFWKTGYWKDHLRGRPYHISALYVVDLNRFRTFAAGDRLRQQYQMLSADPNSLANLDQDLPNNMNTEHQIPIYSLPQEWLWCETWCSDGSLAKAKTIDLCNNPLTKEPKLERAKRILPEWEGLDKEVADVAAKVAAKGQTAEHEKSQDGNIRDEL